MHVTPQSADVLVAIPLGQGQVFNDGMVLLLLWKNVAIPLGQGQVFNQIVL